MSEIKNTFSQGKMNKDLDERLVPSGQYRDAMNVQVSTSEGSNVGTVQNILGNVRVGSVVGSGWTCIGAISDEKNDRFFWFLTNASRDSIFEYKTDGTITPVIVDTNLNVLKFQNKQITGISIIDDILLWTDNVNEPKKINVERCKLGSPLVNAHTKLVVNGKKVVDKEITTTWTQNFVDSSGGTSTFWLSGIGTAGDPKVIVGDDVSEIQTTGGTLYPAPYSSARYVVDIDYSTGEVTINGPMYNGSGTAAASNTVKFETHREIAEEHITVVKEDLALLLS